MSYNVDTDLDGSVSTVKSGWDLSTYHIYVLTSECSFSCGTLLPSIMKDRRDLSSRKVASINIIGKKSGGGTGFVISSGTGDGAIFDTSSCLELTYTDFSSFEYGVEPDLELEHSVFYDDTSMYNALKKTYSSNF